MVQPSLPNLSNQKDGARALFAAAASQLNTAINALSGASSDSDKKSKSEAVVAAQSVFSVASSLLTQIESAVTEAANTDTRVAAAQLITDTASLASDVFNKIRTFVDAQPATSTQQQASITLLEGVVEALAKLAPLPLWAASPSPGAGNS